LVNLGYAIQLPRASKLFGIQYRPDAVRMRRAESGMIVADMFSLLPLLTADSAITAIKSLH
jgi:hypothetical protein